jgi:hypothetical protein
MGLASLSLLTTESEPWVRISKLISLRVDGNPRPETKHFDWQWSICPWFHKVQTIVHLCLKLQLSVFHSFPPELGSRCSSKQLKNQSCSPTHISHTPVAREVGSTAQPCPFALEKGRPAALEMAKTPLGKSMSYSGPLSSSKKGVGVSEIQVSLIVVSKNGHLGGCWRPSK